ncbi:MAG: STAS domain-containing protein [Gammaproteobacteria bacterium]|jgi:anti-anti-sigma regulatory factor
MAGKSNHDPASLEYNLDESLDITCINQIYDELNTLLSDGKPVTIDASNVKRLDTAGVQLLCCWYLEARKKGVEVTFRNTQGVFHDSAKLLGVAEVFEI